MISRSFQRIAANASLAAIKRWSTQRLRGEASEQRSECFVTCYNEEVGVTRAIIEHQFAEYKERYSLRRTHFMGLVMNACHAGLAAIAHNLKKGMRFYQLYGLPEPATTG